MENASIKTKWKRTETIKYSKQKKNGWKSKIPERRYLLPLINEAVYAIYSSLMWFSSASFQHILFICERVKSAP